MSDTEERDGHSSSKYKSTSENKKKVAATRDRDCLCGMKVVITGGCGFLGLHLARLLYQKIRDVHIMLFDKNPADEAAMNFITNGVSNGERVSYGGRHNDIMILEHLNAAFQDADIVFHCAAITSSSAKIDFNKKMQRVNVEGTANVIKACQKQGVRALVFTGDLAQVLRSGLFIQEGITEDVIVRDHEELVMDCFGRSKNEAERKVLQANGFNTTLYTCSIRCPPLYGENDTTFLPNAFWAAERFWKYFPLVGHPSVKMTAMYVENAAWGHVCAAKKLLDKNTKLKVGGQFYYVTDDTPSESYSDFFKRFLRYLDYRVLPIRLPVLLLTCFTYLMVVLTVFLMAIFQYKSLGRVLNYRRQLQMLSTSHTVSREKARTELDYEPHVAFDEAFRQSSQWYLFNIRMLLERI